MLLDFIGLSTVVWGRCRRLTAALKIVWSQHHQAAPSSSINTPAWADLEPCKSRLDDWSRLRVNVHVMQDSHAHMLPVCRTHSCKRSPEALERVCWSRNHGMIEKRQLPAHALSTFSTDTSRDCIGPRLDVYLLTYRPRFRSAEHTRAKNHRRQALEHVCWSRNHGLINKRQPRLALLYLFT